MHLEIYAPNSVDPSIKWNKEKSLTLRLSGGMLYPLSRIRPRESDDELGILCQLICKVLMHTLYSASISKIKMFWSRDGDSNQSPGVLLIQLLIVITFFARTPDCRKTRQTPLRDAVIFSLFTPYRILAVKI